MGKYMRKCGKGIGDEVAVMEVSAVAGGVRTRARALALAAAAAKDGTGTKRKADGGEQFCISYLQLRSRRLVLTPGKTRRTVAVEAAAEGKDSAAASRSASASASVEAGNSAAEGGGEWDRGSRCSSNASSIEVLAAAGERTASSGSGRPETEVVDDGSETTACNYDGGDVHRWRERTPSWEMRQREREPGNLESTARPAAEPRSAPAAAAAPAPTMPSEAEIEAFFAAAERQEHKRFAEKYNYDVVNDVPLRGRYDWVQIKP